MSGQATVPVEDLCGRELDRAVAREVMGWEYIDRGIGKGWHPPGENLPDDVPRYSTDIATAWRVVGRLNVLGCYVSAASTTDGRGFCSVGPNDTWVGEDIVKTGPNPVPEAICRAALKAVRAPA